MRAVVAETDGGYSHETEHSDSPNVRGPWVISDHFLYPPVAKTFTDSR